MKSTFVLPHRPLAVLAALAATIAFWAGCGTTGSNSRNGDAGTNDAMSALPESGSGSSGSGISSGASSSSSSGAGSSGSSGGNTLVGSYAFPVTYSVIDSQLPKSDCGDQTLLDAGDGYASFALWMSNIDLFSDAGVLLQTTPSPSHVLRVEVAGPSYADTGGTVLPDGSAAAPIPPGSYDIGYEAEDDDVLCALPTGTSAILDVFDFTADGGVAVEGVTYTQATAISGTVNVTSISPGHIVGSFDVQLAAFVYSKNGFDIDTQNPTSFSGTFDATNPP